MEPYVTLSGDTIKVGSKVTVMEPKGGNSEFYYVTLLNKFNEPITRADTRHVYKTDEVVFFKDDDGTMFLFTKYYCVNIEPALKNQEIQLATEAKSKE